MKHLIKNERIRKALLKGFNKCLNEEVNRRWLESKTTMIPKKKKAGYKDHRPIAVTVWSSKIMCGFLREKIEIHLEAWAYTYETQYGFTKGGKPELCLYTLAYIANRIYEIKKKKHKTLYYAMVDFKKPYDSVDRKNLIEI